MRRTLTLVGARLRLLAVAVFVLVLMVPLVPSGLAQGTQKEFWNSSQRTFFLHLAQYCDRVASLIRWMDEFDWNNDLDGCGGDVLDPTTNKWTDVFPSFVPFHANVTTQTTAEMHIFILSRAVDQTTVEASYDLGYATCKGRAGPMLLIQERVGGFTDFVIKCTFEVRGEPSPVVKANLTVTVTATHTFGYGTEDSHASYVKLLDVVPAPPTTEVQFFAEADRPRIEFAEEERALAELPPAPEAKGAPALGPAATVAGLAVLVAFVGRGRRR